jgi:hypothetical protein
MERDQVPRFFGEEKFNLLSPIQKNIVFGLCLGGRAPPPKWSEMYKPEKLDRVSACLNGCALFLGLGAVLDEAAAVALWEGAAAAFEPYSVYFLALYQRETGGEDGRKKADDLFVRASDLGMKEAYAQAGLVYLKRDQKSKALTGAVVAQS